MDRYQQVKRTGENPTSMTGYVGSLERPPKVLEFSVGYREGMGVFVNIVMSAIHRDGN